MPNMLSLIKQAAVDAVMEQGPVGLLFGVVVCSQNCNLPAEDCAAAHVRNIRIEERFTLRLSDMVIPRRIGTLFRGERVLILRGEGAKNFILLEVL